LYPQQDDTGQHRNVYLSQDDTDQHIETGLAPFNATNCGAELNCILIHQGAMAWTADGRVKLHGDAVSASSRNVRELEISAVFASENDPQTFDGDSGRALNRPKKKIILKLSP
jgi:hypothetical protein